MLSLAAVVHTANAEKTRLAQQQQQAQSKRWQQKRRLGEEEGGAFSTALPTAAASAEIQNLLDKNQRKGESSSSSSSVDDEDDPYTARYGTLPEEADAAARGRLAEGGEYHDGEESADRNNNEQGLKSSSPCSPSVDGSRFIYFVKTIPRWLRNNPSGNYARALALGAEVRDNRRRTCFFLLLLVLASVYIRRCSPLWLVSSTSILLTSTTLNHHHHHHHVWPSSSPPLATIIFDRCGSCPLLSMTTFLEEWMGWWGSAQMRYLHTCNENNYQRHRR